MSTCTTTPLSYNVQYFYDDNCFTCNEECGNNITNAKCIAYTGANLACSGIETDDSLETALQKIDEQICAVTGDYSQYQFNCLPTWLGESITTESEFVDAITAYACEITENLESFTGVTFPSYQSSVAARFDAIEGPGLTCVTAGVTSADSLDTILTKYCTKFGAIEDFISLDGVTWDTCNVVSPEPTNLSEAFQVLVDQICQIQEDGATLPTFNNSANCLSGSSTDTLVETVDAITERLCLTDVYSGDDIILGCLEPEDTTLQSVIQELVTQTSDLMQVTPTFSGDFVVSATDLGDPCAGVTVSLATPINQDRFVAIDVADTTPGVLEDKLIAGTGITLDTTTTPGTMIVNASGTADTFEVKANTAGSEGYLDEKVAGGSNVGISINVTYNGGTDKIDIVPTIDASALFTYLLDTLEIDDELYTLFCEKIAGCPSPCDAPTDVQVVPLVSSSTTTTGL